MSKSINRHLRGQSTLVRSQFRRKPPKRDAVLDALKALVEITAPAREEWTNEAAYDDACRIYEAALKAIAEAEKENQ